MSTEFIQCLDSIANWQLTPAQKQAAFNLETRLTSLELGYQNLNKQATAQAQTIKRMQAGGEKQRVMIAQLLGMINKLSKFEVGRNTTAIQRQRAMICQLLGMINNIKADQVEHLEGLALLSHDLESHHHDDDFQELKGQIEKLGKECKFQSGQIYALEKLGNKESDRLDAVEKQLNSAPPKRTTRKTPTKKTA